MSLWIYKQWEIFFEQAFLFVFVYWTRVHMSLCTYCGINHAHIMHRIFDLMSCALLTLLVLTAEQLRTCLHRLQSVAWAIIDP